jgi:hypothetical protein
VVTMDEKYIKDPACVFILWYTTSRYVSLYAYMPYIDDRDCEKLVFCNLLS